MPHEQDLLLISYATELARKRQARGLRLNHPEAVAVITDHFLEGATDGRTVGVDGQRPGGAQPRRGDGGRARNAARRPGGGDFPDGTELVTVHHPIP